MHVGEDIGADVPQHVIARPLHHVELEPAEDGAARVEADDQQYQTAQPGDGRLRRSAKLRFGIPAVAEGIRLFRRLCSRTRNPLKRILPAAKLLGRVGAEIAVDGLACQIRD